MAAQKWVSLSTSVSIDQKQEIERRAEASGMSVNEYIKARLFIDEHEPIIKISSLDKWMIKVMAYMSAHITEIANKNLSAEEINHLEPQIADIIERSGFIKKNEILKKDN